MKREKTGSPFLLSTIVCLFIISLLSLPVLADNHVFTIATTNVAKTPSIIGDYDAARFSGLSNPSLTGMDSNGLYVGLLADRFEVSPDNTKWTFYIRENQFWSDGISVTADDAAFSIKMYGDTVKGASWIKKSLSDVSVQGNAVTFTFNKPFSNIPLEFSIYRTFPKHIWESIENPNEYTNPGPYVGCGPYYIEKIDPDAGKLIYQKNSYWKGNDPYYERIEVDYYKNEDAAALALKGGAADTYYAYAKSFPYSGVDSLKSTGNFEIFEKPTSGVTFLAFNLQRSPMSDLSFRNAVAYAINYPEMVEISTLGYGQVPNRGFIPPAMDGYEKTDPLEYNPQKAKEILKAAGYADSSGNGIIEGSDGKDIVLEFLIRSSFERQAELIKEYLEKIGIKVEIKSVEDDTWFELKDQYKYDITMTRSTPWGMLMNSGWATGYFDNRLSGAGVMHIIDDPKFYELCDEIPATQDKNRQKDLARQVQEYYSKNLPAIALFWRNDITPYKKSITGWYANLEDGIMNEITFTHIRPAA